jgi:hypothetical protein
VVCGRDVQWLQQHATREDEAGSGGDGDGLETRAGRGLETPTVEDAKGRWGRWMGGWGCEMR